MGTACAWKLDADCDAYSEQHIVRVANSMKDFSDGPPFQEFVWKRWSPEVKWWAVDFVKELSKQVDIVLRLQAQGDENFRCFFLQGEMLDESEIWDRSQFPSRPFFKKRLSITNNRRAEAKRIAEQKSAEAGKIRLEKEIASLKAKQEELERRL